MATLSLRGRFFVIFGSRPGPKMSPKVAFRQRRAALFRLISARLHRKRAWSRSGTVLGGSRGGSGGLRGASGVDFRWISDVFFRWKIDRSKPQVSHEPLCTHLAKIKNKVRGHTGQPHPQGWPSKGAAVSRQRLQLSLVHQA